MFMVYWFCGSSPLSYGRGVESLAYLMAFLVAVAANLASDIMSRFICKWLDRYDDDRKPN